MTAARAHASRTLATGLPAELRAGASYTVAIDPHDVFGNAVRADDGDLAARLAVCPAEWLTAIERQPNGTYLATLVPPDAAAHSGVDVRVQLRPEPGGGGRATDVVGSPTAVLVTDARGRVERVDGAGVIGKFPLLRDGGWRDDSQDRYGDVGRGQEMTGCFVYQSCTGGAGSFGGRLRFTPGSIEAPAGADFDVTVATFALQLPRFLY